MTSLAFLFFNMGEIPTAWGLWVFLSIGAISLFGIFIPVVSWIDSQRKEKEAFYKAETLRRITESSAEGAKAAMELLREDARLSRIRKREGMKIGGLVCVAVGAASTIFLSAQHDSGYLVGLTPAFVGAALLIYVFFLAAPVE